jgi:hypothetical protein
MLYSIMQLERRAINDRKWRLNYLALITTNNTRKNLAKFTKRSNRVIIGFAIDDVPYWLLSL